MVTKEFALAKIAASRVRAGQRWQHFKGHVYHVTAVGIDEATMTPVAVYVDGDGLTWVRQLNVFVDEVLSDVPRFALLEPVSGCAMQEGDCKAGDCSTHGIFASGRPDRARVRGQGGLL